MDKLSKDKLNKGAIKNDEHFGKYIFKFSNGDVYAGEYKATKKQELVRQGSGKYFCADGSIYEGFWNADYLIEASKLTFANDDVFVGTLANHQFNKQGVYNMCRVGSIEMTFDSNRPLGDIILTDPLGFKWKGTATKTTNDCTLHPINHFKLVDDDTNYDNEEDEDQ